VVDAGNAPLVDDGGGVVDVGVGIDEADDGGDAAQALDDALEGALVVEDEGAAQEEVLRRVARDSELREGDDVGARLARPQAELDYLGGVAFEVAYGGVDLGEGDS